MKTWFLLLRVPRGIRLRLTPMARASAESDGILRGTVIGVGSGVRKCVEGAAAGDLDDRQFSACSGQYGGRGCGFIFESYGAVGFLLCERIPLRFSRGESRRLLQHRDCT